MTPRAGAAHAVPLEAHVRSRYRAAAHHARRAFPGPLGELLDRELSAYADFGYRMGSDALIARVAALVLTAPARLPPEAVRSGPFS